MFIRDEYGAITICDENCKLIAEAITTSLPIYWDLNLPCHTRYTVLFTPQDNALGDRWIGCDHNFIYVSIERRGAYPFDLRHEIAPGYISEKLNIGTPEADDLSKVFAMIGKFINKINQCGANHAE